MVRGLAGRRTSLERQGGLDVNRYRSTTPYMATPGRNGHTAPDRTTYPTGRMCRMFCLIVMAQVPHVGAAPGAIPHARSAEGDMNGA